MAPLPVPRFRPLQRDLCSTVSLDQQLPSDHPARLLWDFVGTLDLTAFRAGLQVCEGGPGASACRTDVLFALWLFATIEGIVSGRELARRCTRDLPFQWLCGGRPINYHTLDDFYSAHADALEGLFVEHIAALRAQALITLTRVTLDGRKVPAAANKQSFHRQATLERHWHEAQEQVQHLAQQRAQAAALAPRQQAAQQRAARERSQRLQAAVQQVQERQQQRTQAKRTDRAAADARASETDPAAAKMKMSDGGYRPAFNVQTLTDEATGIIVTVQVSGQGSDNGLLAPLVTRLQQQQGVLPEAVLADSGFISADDVTQLEQSQVQVYMPPRDEAKDRRAGRDPYAVKKRDTPPLATWRQRMGTAPAQVLYKRRAAVAEWVHAQQSNRGWKRFRLRGLVKAQVEAVWQALGHNVLRLLGLLAAPTGGVRAGVV